MPESPDDPYFVRDPRLDVDNILYKVTWHLIRALNTVFMSESCNRHAAFG